MPQDFDSSEPAPAQDGPEEEGLLRPGFWLFGLLADITVARGGILPPELRDAEADSRADSRADSAEPGLDAPTT